MTPSTLVAAWTHARRVLEAAGVETPIIDARLLLQAAAGVGRVDIVTDPQRALPEGAWARLEALLTRRIAREPVAYILGAQGFWTLDLLVGPDVLIPRPDTEALVRAALDASAHIAAPRVLDLGVGSGAVLLAILAERPEATGVGIDVSPAALKVAQANGERVGVAGRVEWREGRWTEGLEPAFDLIVSNPPYIPSGDIAGLQPEVAQHEPHLALDGGPDGLDAYRAIFPEFARLLSPMGAFAVEIGIGQADDVTALAVDAGLEPRGRVRDLGGRERVIFGGIRRGH